MLSTKYTWVIGRTCAALVAVASCGGLAQGPGVVPNVERADKPSGRHDNLLSPEELELCDRWVPIRRC
jgi:hypothetical protein